MKTVLSLKKWVLLPAVYLIVTPAFAVDLPVAQQSCLYYQGKDPETLSSAAETSAARKFGLKIGLMVRKKQTVQWVLAYQQGFSDAKGDDSTPQTTEQITQRINSYCTDHAEDTLLQTARALTNVAE